MKIGVPLLISGLALLLLALIWGAPVMEAGVMFGTVIPFAIDKSGLEAGSDELKLMEGIEKRVKKMEIPDGMSKEDIAKEVNKIVTEEMKAFKGLNIEELNTLLHAEKGAFAVLKAQGIEIAALKEAAGKQTGKAKTFKEWFHAILPEIEKVFKAGEGSRVFSAVTTAKAAAIMTSENVVDFNAMPDDVIESFSLGGFVAKRRPREYVFDLARLTTVAEVEKYKVWEEEGDTEGAFAIVAQGALKPLTSYELVKNISTAQKVAGKYVVTEEFTKWRKNAYSIIQRLAQQKMIREFAAILTADLITDAAPYVSSALDGQYSVDKVTDYHAIAAVAAQIEALDFMPDMLILNPQDKWRIGMSQDANGQFYLQIPFMSPEGQTTIMGFNVRTSNRVAVGYFLLGEAGLWEIEQEAIKIRVGYGVSVTGGTENGGGNVTAVSSDFDNNRFRVILETYFHDYIASNNDGSFVYANFEVVKAAVTMA